LKAIENLRRYSTLTVNSRFVEKKGNSSTIPEVLILSRSDIEELLSMNEALKAVEYSFKLKAEGRIIMPTKSYLNLPEYGGDFRVMPAYIDGAAGVKWVSVYPNNRRQNLPSVIATIIMCNPYTGCPFAIMDGTYITNIRTGAAGAVAVKYLARKDSSVIGFVGAGRQARMQLLAIKEVLPKIEQVKVFDQDHSDSLKYVKEMGARLSINIRPVETINEATKADIVVTTTPSRTPIVKKQHIRPGTHINAIGADAEGKQELEADLLTNAKIIVDDTEQASHSGEINVPLSEGVITIEDIYGNLGEVVANMKKGRENNEEITIFDSTGLATEDIICAKVVYNRARERDKYSSAKRLVLG
jgi:alanine dehydrogenase